MNDSSVVSVIFNTARLSIPTGGCYCSTMIQLETYRSGAILVKTQCDGEKDDGWQSGGGR